MPPQRATAGLLRAKQRWPGSDAMEWDTLCSFYLILVLPYFMEGKQFDNVVDSLVVSGNAISILESFKKLLDTQWHLARMKIFWFYFCDAILSLEELTARRR